MTERERGAARAVTVIAAILGGCAMPSELPSRDARADATLEDAEPGSRADALVVDGLVLWNEPIDRAPSIVREMWTVIQRVMTILESAPRPPILERDADTDAERDQLAAWYEDVYFPYLENARDDIEPRMDALLPAREAAHARIAEFALFEAASDLLLADYSARHFESFGTRPSIGGCGGGVDEWFGDALTECDRTARSCVVLATRAEGRWRENVMACERRGEACRVRLEGAAEDICEVLNDPEL